MATKPDLTELTFYRGRVALYAILRGLGIGKGDDVVTQAFTCVAVPEAIMASGALPIYVDIEPNGFNMDAGDLERKITPQTRAVIVQHTYGIPADMERIKYVADKTDIPIIEDCCHTFVSMYKGNIVGRFGVGSFYSFEWGKPVVAGIGGSATINDPNLNEKIQSQYKDYRFPSTVNLMRIQLQYFGFKILYRPSFYWPVRDMFHMLGSIGAAESNYNPVQENQVAEDFCLKMPKPLQRRMARKLFNLDVWTRHSCWVSNEYQSRIKSNVVVHPGIYEDCKAVFARYPLLANDKDMLLEQARKAKVELADWYSTPIHPLTGKELELVRYEAGSCPNVEARCKQVVTLPTYSAVGRRDIDRAIKFLNEANL
ncbi:MAG: DegT/DnrJ/EryC1/StrS family aminotransferase [Deltaproteobacteria bacterium]|nr:DegT/DnrJ/EryC1/StrS family aminotransferase [Deltaproteobacteria bacterium]